MYLINSTGLQPEIFINSKDWVLGSIMSKKSQKHMEVM